MNDIKRALLKISATQPRVIASPPTQPKRAAVAILIRVLPAGPQIPLISPSLSTFFDQDWVNHPNATPQILFLHRQDHSSEPHVAFPGGRQVPDDQGPLYTAMRQTWEELGIDLADHSHYSLVGQLDDREITTSLGKRLLMVLSPFVFLQTSPPQLAPLPDPIQSTSIHWIPLSAFVSQKQGIPAWSTVTVDAASRITPKHSALLTFLVRLLIGSMQFPAILLPTEQPSQNPLKLWGLSLGMTLDLMSYMVLPDTTTTTISPQSSPFSDPIHLPGHQSSDDLSFRMEYLAPSLASIFPRFSYPDVNFWIWVFGKRYRQVVRGWEASIRAGGSNDRRLNWSGSAFSSFYAAIRKALVVVIVLRALGLLLALAFAIWWVFS